MNTEKNTKEKYDTQDDYYYTVINNIEINIRGYKKDRISLWIYDHNTEIELDDNEYKSLHEIQNKIKTLTNIDNDLPTINQLLELQ